MSMPALTNSVPNLSKSFTIPDSSKICGLVGLASSEAQLFTTPGYPYGYKNSERCQWTLTAPPGEQVELVITEGQSEGCCDRLQVLKYPIIVSIHLKLTSNVF